MSEARSGQFFLYWIGVFIVALSIVGVLLTISGLLVDILSTQCYFPYVSPMLGIREPPAQPANVTMFADPQPPPNRTMLPEQNVNTISNHPYPYPYYCDGNPAVAVVRFVFKLLSALVFTGVGLYMMMNGKKQ